MGLIDMFLLGERKSSKDPVEPKAKEKNTDPNVDTKQEDPNMDTTDDNSDTSTDDTEGDDLFSDVDDAVYGTDTGDDTTTDNSDDTTDTGDTPDDTQTDTTDDGGLDDTGDTTDDGSDGIDGDTSGDDFGDGTDDTSTEEDPNKQKGKQLLLSYIDLYNDLGGIIDKITSSMTYRNKIEANTISEVSENLNHIRNTLYDYIINMYKSNSYEVNLYNYYSTVNNVKITNKIIEKIIEIRNKP